MPSGGWVRESVERQKKYLEAWWGESRLREWSSGARQRLIVVYGLVNVMVCLALFLGLLNRQTQMNLERVKGTLAVVEEKATSAETRLVGLETKVKELQSTARATQVRVPGPRVMAYAIAAAGGGKAPTAILRSSIRTLTQTRVMTVKSR